MKIIASVYERVTERSVSLLPEDHWAAPNFTLVIRNRGRGRWSVEWPGRGVLNRHTRRFEPETSEDRMDDDWLALHRFNGREAMKLACAIAPELRSGGITARQALIMKEETG